jgi:hypothetical protein
MTQLRAKNQSIVTGERSLLSLLVKRIRQAIRLG